MYDDLSNEELLNQISSLNAAIKKQKLNAEIKNLQKHSTVGKEGILESAWIGVGKGASDLLLKTPQQIAAAVTGDTKKQKKLKQEVQFEQRAISKIGSPIAASLGEVVPYALIPGGTGAVASNLVKSKALRALAGGTVAGATAGVLTPTTAETSAEELKQRLLGGTAGGVLGGITGGAIYGGGSLIKGVGNLIKKVRPPSIKAEKSLKQFVNEANIPNEELKQSLNLVTSLQKQGYKVSLPAVLNNKTFINEVKDTVANKASRNIYTNSLEGLNKELTNNINKLRNVFNAENVDEGLTAVAAKNAAGKVYANKNILLQQQAKPFYDRIKQTFIQKGSQPIKELEQNPRVNKLIKDLEKDEVFGPELEKINNRRWDFAPESVRQAQVIRSSIKDNEQKVFTLLRDNPKQERILRTAEQEIAAWDNTNTLFKYELTERFLKDKISQLRFEHPERAKILSNDLKELQTLLNKFPQVSEARQMYQMLHEGIDALDRTPLHNLMNASNETVTSSMKKLTSESNPNTVISMFRELNRINPNLSKDIYSLYIQNLMNKPGKDALAVFKKELMSNKGKKIMSYLTNKNPELKDIISSTYNLLRKTTQKDITAIHLAFSDLPVSNLAIRVLTKKTLNLLSGNFSLALAKLMNEPNKYIPVLKEILNPKITSKIKKLRTLDNFLSNAFNLAPAFSGGIVGAP